MILEESLSRVKSVSPTRLIASLRLDSNVNSFYFLSIKLYVFQTLGLGLLLIFWHVDETNWLSLHGISTSCFCFSRSSFEVISTFSY
jgi:hypothetical protein